MKERILTLEVVKNFIQAENNYPVDFDDAWTWCGYSTKANAVRKLKSNFQENVDYIVFINLDEKSNSKPLSYYKLTSDCFKHFGMIAQTEKGKEVRSYFISCEKELSEIKQKPMSPAELALLQAQNVLAIEKKLTIIESKVDTLISDKNKALEQLKIIELPKVLPLQKSERSALNQLVRTYSKSINIDISEAWNHLYDEFLYIYHIDIKQCATNRNISNLDYVESIAKMSELYSLAYELFIADNLSKAK